MESHYDLEATLNCGQAFRWRLTERGWTGVIGTHPVCLCSHGRGLEAETAQPVSDWGWLTEYLQTDLNLEEVLRTFPEDQPMRAALASCRGLRLLRQDPWECLASFILSSTKQIVQIRQIVESLCQRYGEPPPAPTGADFARARTFPSPARLALAGETELRACKMGFRAPYLLAAAQKVAAGELDLARLGARGPESARAQLMQLPGVGPKIADCVLLFAYGFQDAFPLDVWVLRALRQLYFPGRRIKLARLRRFAATHFGPYAGYAQQYLFHYIRNVKDEGGA
ncbi:MAG: DNA glycosylase [Verrucomicrobiota bacterium]